MLSAFLIYLAIGIVFVLFMMLPPILYTWADVKSAWRELMPAERRLLYKLIIGSIILWPYGLAMVIIKGDYK